MKSSIKSYTKRTGLVSILSGQEIPTYKKNAINRLNAIIQCRVVWQPGNMPNDET
jgi:hypothetical protein